jgi:hypothetical protein
MYHKELVTHIHSKKVEGVSDDEIQKELIQDGWSDEDIKQAFYYFQHPDEIKHFSFKRLMKSEVKESTFLATIVFLFISFLGATLYFKATVEAYELTILTESGPSKINFTYGIQPSLSNPDFFAKVKNQFIESKKTFIEVDLSQMVARVYKNGIAVLEVPVKTKGKEGSWWETPAGLYKIETREKTHYSSMGHVTQPWSMQFQGNFFIHGWPKYDDGSPVSSTFSGGCVRLADEDAKKIFDAVAVGTPILVYEKDFIPDSFSYKDPKPTMTANSFMVADILNNHIFLEKNRDAKIIPSSITKLMTALVATEYINIEKTTIVNQESLIETNTPRLTPGMSIDVYQLLFPLLRESSNESAETIARLYGRNAFINHMNQKAKAIGMTHTTFVDPTGISKENTSTAQDMFMLAKYIYNNRSFLFNITSGKVRTNTYGKSIFTDLGDANELSTREFFFGGISGVDEKESKYNFSVFELPLGGVTRPIFFMSFESKDSKEDTLNAITFLRSYYK